MAMTTEDYMEMGRQRAAALDGEPTGPHPYAHSSTSWQGRAYWAGFVAKAEQLASGAALQKRKAEMLKNSPLALRIKAERAHWPHAAAHHVDLLAQAWVDETDERRQERLSCAMNRIIHRYNTKLLRRQYPGATTGRVSSNPNKESKV